MKNKVSLLSILSLLVIAGCNNNVSSSSNKTSSSNIITSSSEVSSSLQENEASILVEYFYSNGEYFGKYKEKGIVGEKYSINRKN